MMRSKIVKTGAILAVLLVVGAGCASTAGSSGGSGQATVPASGGETTATVDLGRIEQVVTATGNVAASRQMALAFESSGRILEVAVSPGQLVQAGEVLAVLDKAPLELRVRQASAGVASAEARLRQAQDPASAEEMAAARAALASAEASHLSLMNGPSQADLASAKASLQNAEAGVQQAQAAYDAVKSMPNIGMLPQSINLQKATIEYERALAVFEAAKGHPTASETAASQSQVAQARLKVAQLEARPDPDDVAIAQASLVQAQVSLSEAQAALEQATLAAPFDGVVITVNVDRGGRASPGSPAVVVAQTGTLVVEIKVDEVDVPGLAVGQPAHLRFTALKGQTLEGALTMVAPSATAAGGAQAFAAEITFSAGTVPVRLGMTSEASIVTESVEQALLAPNRAITVDREAGRYHVNRLLPGGATETVEVRIGLRSSSHTQILSGLAEGDRLVLPQVVVAAKESGGMGLFGGGAGRAGSQ